MAGVTFTDPEKKKKGFLVWEEQHLDHLVMMCWTEESIDPSIAFSI